MRKLLLLLAWGGSLAAGRDAGGVVPRMQDIASRGADPEAVRALPLETGAARRGLQSSSDACDYVCVGLHGLDLLSWPVRSDRNLRLQALV